MSQVDPTISPEKWERIRAIYARLLDAPELERTGLAHQLCQGDPEIESVIDGMLSAHGKAGSFLGQPAAVALGLAVPEPSASALTAGTVLASRFHILRLLNSGGMGSVYESWDSELQEILALKTIRPEIASDLSVIERFKREVKQARQVTHPNICRVYDLSYHDLPPGNRIWFLTMQLLKGTTLIEHIRENGLLSTKQALPLVEQMVAGLSAAHEHGIVHRDFKSANVMLVTDGQKSVSAVITDFGLASPANGAGPSGKFAREGTPAYAAPEQWVDGVVAPAGDQYSLGVVMCEMLTGERPGPAALNQGPPKAARLPENKKIDHRWEGAIRRCLEINPAARFRSLTDILAVIDPARRRKRALNWVAGAALLALLSITGVLINKSMNQPYSLTDLRLLTPAMDYSEGPQLSADAKTIAYVSDRAESGNRDIWVQSLPDGIPKRITTDPATDEDPSISPDGRLVAFESSRTPRGIYLADVEHGGEKLIAAGGRGATFSPDGRSLVYSTGDEYRVGPSGKLFLYDLETGKSVPLASEMKDARNAVWNSDGDHILLVGCASLDLPYPSCKDWWITTREGAAPRPTGALPALLAQSIRPIVYFGGWHGNSLLFSAERAGSFGLWELKIDPVKGTVSGPPKEPIASDHRNFIISSSLVGKMLAISQLNPDIHVWRIEHAGNPERATATKVTDDPDYDYDPGISRNGRWLVFVRGSSDARKIYLQDTQSGINGPLPFRHSSKAWPIIDDAGTTIAYEASERNASGIWIGSLDGRERKLCNDCRSPTGWFGQEEAVLHGNSALSEVRMTPTAGGQSRTILKMPGGTVRDAVWSPESRFLLFTAFKPGSDGQIYAARFLPGQDAPDSHWVPITGEALPSRTPRWSGDGKTIFYLSKADGFWCVWGQHFDPVLGRTVDSPFAVRHFHDFKFSPDGLSAEIFNIAVTGDSLYLNVLQTRGTIWLGKLSRKSLFSFSQ